MLRRDEVCHSIEDSLETLFVNFAIDCMQVEDLHEGLSLCGFNAVLMFACLFILKHFYIMHSNQNCFIKSKKGYRFVPKCDKK